MKILQHESYQQKCILSITTEFLMTHLVPEKPWQLHSDPGMH